MKMSISELQTYVLAYLEYLQKLRGYSQKTILSYKGSLIEALESARLEQEDGVLVLNIIPFREKIAKNNKKTVSKKLSAIRGFREYMDEKGFALKIIGDSKIKIPKTLPRPISSGSIFDVLKECNLQERVLVLLLYSLGLRVSELSNLKKDEINSEWVRVVGKGSKMREIPMIPAVSVAVKEYVNTYSPKCYLFEKNERKLSEEGLRYLLKEAFGRVGLKATPHQLRHSFATDLLNNGAGILDVKELLGHSSISTTEIYTKLTSATKLKSYLESHPLCSEEKI